MARRGKYGLPPHVSPARSRHGKVRLRFRKGLFSTYLGSPYPSEEFWEEYRRALDGVKAAAGTVGARRRKPGSIGALIASYYVTPEWLGLAPSTRQTFRRILDRFGATYGDLLVRGLQREVLKKLIGKMDDRPTAANRLLRLLRVLLDYAVEIDWIATNPARGMKGFKVRSAGFATWTEADIVAFEKRHPIGTKARLAMTLLLYTAQRRGDVVRLGWQHVQDGRIALVQEKTKEPLRLLMHPALEEVLEATPRNNLTFLVTEFGAPFTPAGFGNWFRERCDEAGLKGRSAHGLRKAAARRLAQAGNSSKRIASVTGHRTLKEVERYTRETEQQQLADEAIGTMPDRSDREQNFPNLASRSGKRQAKVRK